MHLPTQSPCRAEALQEQQVMGTRIAARITRSLIAVSVIEQSDYELYSYGFFLLISKAFFFLVTVTAGLLTGAVLESILFYVVFMLFRSYAGGIHAKTEAACTVLTTLALIASVLAIHYLQMYTGSVLPAIMLGIGSLCILVLCPQDTGEKPLDTQEKRRYRKICLAALLVCVIASLIAWHCQQKGIFYPISCGICLESILLILGKICSRRK